MANPEFGKWSTMAHAWPSSSGLYLDRSGGWRIILEAAAITNANLSGATQPVWVDVTGRLIDAAWGAGDAALESRLPVGSSNLRCRAFGDLVGSDPMSLAVGANDRFGTQCLLRFSLMTPSGDWRPLFLHVIDTIRETWDATSPGRIWELDSFDTAYLIAGYRRNASYGTLGATAEDALMALCTNIGFPFTRYHQYFEELNTVGGEPGQAPLGLMQRVCDSVSGESYIDNVGALRFNSWGYHDEVLEPSGAHNYYPAAPRWTVVDGYTWVAAGAGYAFPTWSSTVLPTALQMVNSVDRIVRSTEADTTKIVGASRFSTPTLSTRYDARVDRPGWPKRDLLWNNAAQGPDVGGAAFRSSDPTRPEWIAFDTQTAPGTQLGNQKDLDTLLRFLTGSAQVRRCYTFQRRNHGTAGWWSSKVIVGAHENVISRDRNQFRWQATHFLNTWPGA